MNVSPEQLRAFRVRRHHLDEPASDPLAVVSRLCGVHAQVASSAELTLWARVRDLPPGWVSGALWEERTLLKTWAMRGTLHLLPAAEMRLWLSALSTLQHYLKPSWLRAFGVTGEQLESLLAGVDAALAGGPLTREELATAVGDERLKESWGALLKPAAFRGRLCFAQGEGQRVRFQQPPPFEPLDPDEAMVEVARRYLSAYGPAPREQFARWWAWLSPAQAGRLLASVAEEVTMQGARAYVLPEHVEELAAATPVGAVNLLPAFDQYVAAASGSLETLLAPGVERSEISRQAGWLSPVLVLDGLVCGVWSHERRGRRVVVTVRPRVRLAASVRAKVEREAERLARFLGGELSLEWAT